MILFSKEGVFFSYKDRVLLDWAWPWISSKKPSEIFLPKKNFSVCAERVFGVNVDAPLEVFCENFLLQNTSYVILSEIDVLSKERSFWLALPESSRMAFTNDFVFMRCDSLNKALTLASNIPNSLSGVVWIYHEGSLRKWKEYDTQAYQE